MEMGMEMDEIELDRQKSRPLCCFPIILCSYFDLKFGMRCKRSLWQSNSNERTYKKNMLLLWYRVFYEYIISPPKTLVVPFFVFHHQKKKKEEKKKQTKTTQDNWWHKKCFENGFKGWNEWKNLLPENKEQHEQALQKVMKTYTSKTHSHAFFSTQCMKRREKKQQQQHIEMPNVTAV